MLDRHDVHPVRHRGRRANRPQPAQVADVSLALVQQGREIADPEVGIVGGFPAYLRAQPQVAPHQRRHAHPRRRVDVVEASAVDDHRPIRMHGVLRGRGVPAPHEVAYPADLAAGGSSSHPCTGTDTQPAT